MNTPEEILHKHVDKEQLDDLSENLWPDIIDAMNEFEQQETTVDHTEPNRFNHWFVIGDNPDYVKIKYTDIDDGLNSTVRFPNIGEIVVLKGVHYECKMVTHEYDNAAIAYHLIEAQFNKK